MGKTDGLHDPYEDQLAAARYRAERDALAQAMQRVADSMREHALGVEGMEDSPVAGWERELRAALGGFDFRPTMIPKSDGGQARQEPDRLMERLGEGVERAVETVPNALRLLEEDGDAARWVREHGGLERIKNLLNWVVGHCSTKQQLDFDFWLSGRVMHELDFDEDMADRDEVERRLLARLMPEGMEWLVEAWPRFKDDSPVRLLDDFERYGEESVVSAVTMYADGSFALNCRAYSKGERVNRPAPKVLDADGVEIRVGDTVYHTNSDQLAGEPRVVERLEELDTWRSVRLLPSLWSEAGRSRMMVTDDERREVARRLRALDYGDLQESLICAYLDALGIEGYADWVGIARRLADLIEPGEPKARCVAEVKIDGERLEKLVHDAAVELTGIDRDALLELADEMDAYSGHFSTGLQECTVQAWAVAIREALGVCRED